MRAHLIPTWVILLLVLNGAIYAIVGVSVGGGFAPVTGVVIGSALVLAAGVIAIVRKRAVRAPGIFADERNRPISLRAALGSDDWKYRRLALSLVTIPFALLVAAFVRLVQ